MLLPANAREPRVQPFLEAHCYDCHDNDKQEGSLNLQSLKADLRDPHNQELWTKVHDRVRDGEMPPKKRKRPAQQEILPFLHSLSNSIAKADQARIAVEGRARVRRLNRFEFENSLREGLNAPWLQVADLLPEDGVAHLFNKVGDRLDISHVQIAKYLSAAEHALRLAVQAAAFPTTTNRFYAREEPVMHNYLRYRFGQMAATRAAIPLLGTTPEPDVIRGKQPLTVGDSDPERREQEAFGFVSGTYTATTKYDFTRMNIPTDGRYRLRMKSYTFMAGPNGANGGDDHGLTGGTPAWWRPSRTVAFPGIRSEPVTLYALADSGDSRWLATYDALPEPAVIEREVHLKKDEKIRPDATRLVRTRPGWKGNPLATANGIPGLALNWLEVEGPLHDQWPPASYKAVFDDLPFEVTANKRVVAVSKDEASDARRLLLRFVKRFWREPSMQPRSVEPFVAIYSNARALGEDFTEALIAACASSLCSADFLFLDAEPGSLPVSALASRLAFFIWNGPPDEALLRQKKLASPTQLRAETDRLLNDTRSSRFINSFLDYWLDLRELNANAPDAELYPEYYLDDWLTESSLLETRAFFAELMQKDLSVRNLVDSDFAYVNERLAQHYGFESFEGAGLRRVSIPQGSPRGGLITHASVLRVTANGTTTSPVIRGAWVVERLLGVEIPPPPSGVEAITPDTRGATTIREQLDKHRAAPSCAACHAKFDPVGFALESFDIAGGWRERYRAVGEQGESVSGFGKNGHAFVFKLAQTVDSTGELASGSAFKDIRELKRLLAKDERALARNLVHRFLVYSTGAPVSFSDRAAIEVILDKAAANNYGVRSLLHEVVQSPLFRIK
ncbi:MAG TPA: DUF1592 domain-containing protein [Methylomirabilota bacterium]|nr:DUF1592 domain-containing protein [Methylomirabilota bacterium]